MSNDMGFTDLGNIVLVIGFLVIAYLVFQFICANAQGKQLARDADNAVSENPDREWRQAVIEAGARKAAREYLEKAAHPLGDKES